MSFLGSLHSAYDAAHQLGSKVFGHLSEIGNKVREHVGHGISYLADKAHQAAGIANELSAGIGTAIHPYAGQSLSSLSRGIQAVAPVAKAAGKLIASHSYSHAIKNAKRLSGVLKTGFYGAKVI